MADARHRPSVRVSIADPGGPDGPGGTSVLDRELQELLKKEKILESAITGKPVKALCGKKWTPGRDPEKFPVCPTCKEVYERMKSE
jgi:hypothetical protein